MKTVTHTETEPMDKHLGEPVFVRTVTMHYTGLLTSIGEKEIGLSDAAWIADSGRFSIALATGELDEVEPFPDGEITVGRGAIVDVSSWSHALPREVK